MQKRETRIPARAWSRPAVRRIMSGSAEFGGGGAVDGSGIQS
ncbi:MAG: hypothetical protein QOJ91_1839 [Sphingomonadales bacterium]|nr:hypothetical protein [Sphingomonadales bacterium]